MTQILTSLELNQMLMFQNNMVKNKKTIEEILESNKDTIQHLVASLHAKHVFLYINTENFKNIHCIASDINFIIESSEQGIDTFTFNTFKTEIRDLFTGYDAGCLTKAQLKELSQNDILKTDVLNPQETFNEIMNSSEEWTNCYKTYTFRKSI